jgi:GDP-L-fucose synthase
MNNYDKPGFVNIGVGEDISIRDLAKLIQEITGYEGNLKFNTSKPDGTPRKLMDISKLEKTGFKANIGLKEGITSVYHHFKKQFH